MGRPSSLTDKQWDEIGKRLLTGRESARSLAREFGTSETSLRRKFPAQRKDVKTVANQIVAADAAFRALPVSSQIDTLTLVDELKAISMHLASAAKYGAATAHRLAAIANGQVDKVDDANPLESQETMQGISALTKMANEASVIPMGLLSATKGAINLAGEPPTIQSRFDPRKISSAALEEFLASRD
jgi:hypothetical protein